MADPLIGRLNSITHDRHITVEEFGELEKAVFADGIVTSLEVSYVRPSRFTFESDDDHRRLSAIVYGKAYTLETYRRTLQSPAYGLTPSNTWDELETISEHGFADKRAQVTHIDRHTGNGFTIYMTKEGQAMTWQYDGAPTDFESIDTSLLPLDLYEMFLSIEDYKQTDLSVDQKRAAAKVTRAITRIEQDFEDADYSSGKKARYNFYHRHLPQAMPLPLVIEDFPFFIKPRPWPICGPR